MTGYRFDMTAYKYLKDVSDVGSRFQDITDYVIDTLKLLI